jgi:D-3-phosphoglycerate dehydrogenase
MRTKYDAKSKGTILVADYDFGDVGIELAIIEGAGYRLVAAQCKSEDEVIEHGRDADGVLAQYAPIGARAIDAFTHCRVIARYGTGVDAVDVDAATHRGIQVTNAPNDWCADEVADHAVALWLAATRKICQYDRAMRRGEWHWQTGHPIWRLRGRVFGLLSFGAIARRIAERVRPFGVDIWAHDRSSIPRRSKGEMCGLSPSIGSSKPRTICSSRPRSRQRPATCSIGRRCGG